MVSCIGGAVSGGRYTAQTSVESVQEQVREVLDGRIVVGWDLHSDLRALGLSYPPEMV